MNIPRADAGQPNADFWPLAEVWPLIDSISRELAALICSELEHAAEGARLFGQDAGVWVHERANVIERLIRDTSQVNR